MYAQFFGLKHEPFSIAPDPRYLFMSERHREALAHLLYGVRGGGGFVLLTGEIGAGKTTVCRCFLEQIPKRCNVAYIFNPKLTVTELLKSVCDEFRVPYAHEGPGAATVKDYLDPLNEFLLKTHAVGQNNVLIIDEAQSLSADVLEQLRLLTNLETSERKLLQIILIGQPELRAMLAQPELEQLAQRVIARFHLEALSQAETRRYIRHRLAVAGLHTALPFDRSAMRRIQKLSRGVPRRINLLCDRALLGAYASGKTAVGGDIVDKAAGEVFDGGAPARPFLGGRRVAVLGGAGLLAGAVLLGLASLGLRSSGPVRAAAAASAPSHAPKAAAATASAASAAAPAAMDLKTAFQSMARSEKEAWRELAPAWQLQLGEGDPCQAAPRQQVHCFRSGAGLGLIRQLGRPGIVTLYDDSGKPAYALLTGLGSRSASLRVGGTAQTLPLVTLAKAWRGDFATFWRAPPGGLANDAVVDEASPLAPWLAAQLAKVDGGATTPQGLKARVYAFQLAQGLKPDGLAGPTTLMQLNRAVGIDEPRLQAEPQ